LDGIVDKFFVLESATTHRFGLKPLIFARNYERVAPFRDRIVHIVLDDEDVTVAPSILSFTEREDEWSLERWQRKMVFEAFRRYIPDLTNDDVIIHGDIDELPQGDFINHLKYCQPKVFASNLAFFPVFFSLSFSLFSLFSLIECTTAVISTGNSNHVLSLQL
jgi:beta-1,4-mannosyl-glycoprotein beta-1,4-N-acetylglucosaminyltransferase